MQTKLQKNANFGGPGNDASFEQAFSSITHSYIQDIAPTLLDYELGFQLLDRNEDDTKAVGLIGFKIGSQYLYIPAFYINNELKGHELLYIKNEDRFVPLKESWVNYLMNKKPKMLGNGVNRQMSDLNIRQPNYTRLRLPPNKIASARMPDWVHGFLPCYSALRVHPAAALPASPSLPEFLKKAGRETLTALLKTASVLPNVARGIERFHGLKMLEEVWQEIKTAEEAKRQTLLDARPTGKKAPRKILNKLGSLLSPHPITTGALRIHTKVGAQTSLLPLALSDMQKEALWKIGVLIEDTRLDADVSKLYKTQLRQTLCAPPTSGIYDVLMRDSSDEYGMEKCIILKSPHSAEGPSNWVTIIRKDNKKWCNAPADEVYTSKQYPDSEWEEWVDGLAKAGKFSASRSVHVLVNKEGEAVSPFTVDKSIGSANGLQTYTVDFRDSNPYSDNKLLTGITRANSQHMKSHGKLQIDVHEESAPEDNPMTPRRSDPRKIRVLEGCLVVPDTFKHYTLHETDELPYGARDESDRGNYYASLRLGDMTDVQTALFKHAAALKVWSDGNEVEINGSRMSKMAGLIHMVQNIGLREAVAHEALQDAELRGTQHYYVKLADAYNRLQPGPGAPTIPDPEYGQEPMIYGGATPSMEPQPQQIPIDDMQTPSQNSEYYDPTVDLQSWQLAQDAAAAGQQDVFDTATIGSLLKIHHDDAMIDELLPGLMDGLDKAGRLLFLFYAHSDKFEDRYGKTEMPELEDSLRTAFEDLGDLCLYLKQKTIESAGEDSFEVNLDDMSEG